MPSWDKITFNFTHFDLEGYSSVSSSRCWGDYVVVRGSYIIKRCGTRNPFIITRYGSVSVTFYSDSSTTRSGFLAFYQKETRPLTTRYPYSTLAPTTYPSSGYHSTVYTCNSYQRTTRKQTFYLNVFYKISWRL